MCAKAMCYMRSLVCSREGFRGRCAQRRFNALVHRLAKLAATLPAVVLGWFALEKLRLPSDRRATALVSANDDYAFKATSVAAERNCPNAPELGKSSRGNHEQIKPEKFN